MNQYFKERLCKKLSHNAAALASIEVNTATIDMVFTILEDIEMDCADFKRKYALRLAQEKENY